MFTGLIEDLGHLRELRHTGAGARLTVATALPMAELAIGESIAVNGACLTVTAFGGGTFSADVSPETLERSTLGRLTSGTPVNLERALRLSDRLGGHLVTGHIDAIATVASRVREGNAERFTFRLDPVYLRHLVEKGSVAIDGISLTVNAVAADSFGVAVIPHTLSITTLKLCRPGDQVNIETDLIGKYLERLLQAAPGGEKRPAVDLQFLAKHGFL
ncbi:MAG: riboflavin synthase [Desulfuromonadales bacterium]|nr:riboflavin synthase [Desulfuromonadales bacterium]